MELLKKYNEIFTDVFSVNEEELNELFSRENIASWDSVHQLNLITYIEDIFDIMLDTEDILGLVSYEKGKDILSTKYGVLF